MENKINFEPIGEAMKLFDTDKIDIYRRTEIQNPDGTTGETSSLIPMYSNVYCHIAFITADNPDSATADTQPIIVGLKINCPLDVDIQNGDYVIANKLSDSGEVLETYKGLVGEPRVAQSRKSVEMKMETDV